MPIGRPQPIEYVFKGLNVKDLVNDNFIRAFHDEKSELIIDHICFYYFDKSDSSTDAKSKKRVYLGHATQKEQKENIARLKAENPKDLKKVFSLIKKTFND